MDRFTYDVNVTDSGDYLFSIASYTALSRRDKPSATDEFLPIIMSIGKCIPKNQQMEVILSDLANFHRSENAAVRTDFRKHYIQALRGSESDWHLVRVDIGLDANLTLTYYNSRLNAEDSLELKSGTLKELRLSFEVPHRDGRPATHYSYYTECRERIEEPCAIIEIQKETADVKKVICYSEGDDNITITEYTDL